MKEKYAMLWKFWLILSGVFLVIEIISVGFLMFWFAVGALVTTFVSLFTDNIAIQSGVFIVVSTGLLFATKPFVNKILPKEPKIKTNSFSNEGKTGIVTIDINPTEGSGQVKIDGEAWSAKSSDNTYISKDTEVIVEKIEGVKAIVKPLK
jgi:membrane protein implicated in regulation of membrane protease activity